MQKIIHRAYTDEKAVDAADASNKFVERNVVNDVTGVTTLKLPNAGIVFDGQNVVIGTTVVGVLFQGTIETGGTYNLTTAVERVFNVRIGGTDEYSESTIILLKNSGSKETAWYFTGVDAAKATAYLLSLHHDKIDVHNLPIKDIKNHADATLSGTPKLIELLIGTTPYYFKVYPTKT